MLLRLLAVGAVLLTGGLLLFASTIAGVAPTDETPTDAIVVWTGGADRISTGLDLLAAGRAKKLFISGVHRGVSLPELLRVSRPQLAAELHCCIVLGHSADDTRGNAAETAEWMRAEGFHSMRLVTANYHMRRSVPTMRRAMPEAEILPHPVVPAGFDTAGWWRSREGRATVIAEYGKYLLSLWRGLWA